MVLESEQIPRLVFAIDTLIEVGFPIDRFVLAATPDSCYNLSLL